MLDCLRLLKHCQGQKQDLEAEQASSPNAQPEKPTSALTEQVDQALSAQNEHATSRNTVRDQKQPAKPTKCTFSEVVPIDLSRFLDKSTHFQ
jgi:hypothetical protein